ncbi:MAG: hypothetical protein J7L80_01080 [Thermoplasmata archaeon]|nr:hypothetical protein [Thermoplasmata archaeon]
MNEKKNIINACKRALNQLKKTWVDGKRKRKTWYGRKYSVYILKERPYLGLRIITYYDFQTIEKEMEY